MRTAAFRPCLPLIVFRRAWGRAEAEKEAREKAEKERAKARAEAEAEARRRGAELEAEAKRKAGPSGARPGRPTRARRGAGLC